MNKKLIFVFIMLLSFAFFPIPGLAESTAFYSPEGNIITENSYNEIVAERKAEFEELKAALVKVLKDRNGETKRPHLNENEQPSDDLFVQVSMHDENGNPTTAPAYLDSKGRPIYDSEGRRYVYAEQEAAMKANERYNRSRPVGGLLTTFGPNDPLTGTMSYKRTSTGLVPVWQTYAR
jgi:hypothetical protein